MRPLSPLPDWCALEHRVQDILTKQEIHGWYFDEQKAQQLESSLRREMEETQAILCGQFPFVAGPLFTPKRDNSTQGYRAGCEIQRIKEFNPTSRDHIAWILTTHLNVKLTKTTTTGKPIIDEIILTEIDIPFSRLCAKCLTIKKKLGMISEGVNAWRKLVTTSNRIHHHCSVATNTFRCAQKPQPWTGTSRSRV